MNCPKCNATIAEGATFCGVCGHKLEQASPAQPSPEQASGQPINHEFDNSIQQANTPVNNAVSSPDGIIIGSFKEGFEHFKKNPGIMIGMVILTIIVGAIGDRLVTNDMILVYIAYSLVTAVLNLGIGFTFIQIVRGEEVNFNNVLQGFSKFFPLIVTYILFIVCIAASLVPGLILAWFLNMSLMVYILLAAGLVLGLIVALGLSMALMLVLDKDYSPVDSLKASWSMMRGYKWSYFGFGLFAVLVNLLGFLALVIGLLVSIPVTMAAYAVFYDRVLRENPPVIG